MLKPSISKYEQDLLQQMFKFAADRAEDVLAAMVEQTVNIKISDMQLIDTPSLQTLLVDTDVQASLVCMRFEGMMTGAIALLFPQDSTKVLINTLTQSSMRSYEMDVFCMGTLTEVGNIIINAVMSQFSDTSLEHVSFNLPDYVEIPAPHYPIVGDINNVVMTAKVGFNISGLHISSLLIIQLTADSLSSFFSALQAGVRR